MKNSGLMIFFLALSFSFLILFNLKGNSITQQILMGMLVKISMIIAILICSNELLWKKEKKK